MKAKIPASKAVVSSSRAAAFDILLRVEQEASYASELLHAPAYRQLEHADHTLATELVMGVLRWQSRLDAVLAGASSQALRRLDTEVLVALRLGLYQLGWLSRIPARAAIHESVELVKRAGKRSAAAFVNAVLRKLAAEGTKGGGPLQAAEEETTAALSAASFSSTTVSSASPCSASASLASLAADYAHPLWLVERWSNEYGLEAAGRICRHDQRAPVTAIRVRRQEAVRELEQEGVELLPGRLLASARRVAGGRVADSAALRKRDFVIQDEGSQLVAALAGSGRRLLDCCAAPGGKTLAMADRNPGASIDAVERHPHRARLLSKLVGGGAPEKNSARIRVVAADATQLPYREKFDCILADVPCSGTGTLARNPEIKWRLRAGDLEGLARLQRAILASAMAQACEGGRVIYATCSLEREENEAVVEGALSENPGFRAADCRVALERLRQAGELAWEEISSLLRGPYLRTLPGVHPCDGFFAAILEKV